ncbi:hypothetical protein N9H39_09725, partial [Gammaproteobacteria bacterium]|nr:hypothetical protein [Gammaproteobacteria bacterium]
LILASPPFNIRLGCFDGGVEMIKRSAVDRRSGIDRRGEYYISLFEGGWIERRNHSESRTSHEQRNEWTRINQWTSIHVPLVARSGLSD